jgi:hypothetical protein
MMQQGGFSGPSPFTKGLTIQELVDVVQNDLTISCALPKLLPDMEVRRIAENIAAPWFYQNYQYSLSKIYYYVHHKAFETEEWTKYRYIQLPCEIQSITWIYQVRDTNLMSIGINSPNLSINMGVSNQPYVSSVVSTIGELGVYKTILDSFSDMLNQLSKHTVKFHYNQMMNRLNILTSLKSSLILEAYANVDKEALYADPLFIRYIIGYSKKQLGAMMSRYNFNLPGGVQYNADSLISEGNDEVTKVEEEIKGMSNSAFMYMVKR